MEGQREMIARAALEVLLAKGLHEASLREICAQAGVSIGAFYNHFATKTDAIIAARTLDLAPGELAATTWAGYVDFITQVYCSRDPDRLRRRRLSLQFAAELLTMKESPPGLSQIYDVQRQQLRSCLQAIQTNGEAPLPLGLDRTVEIHAMLALGASYRLSNDLDLPVTEAEAILVQGLRISAGIFD
jgi:AcrR family transcriptional regulator